MRALLQRCQALGDGDQPPSLGQLRDVLDGAIDADELDTLLIEDEEHPYGRRVLLDGPVMEMMIASWTRGVPCAPHDHGGSVGAVRVLRGEAIHRMYRLGPSGLELVVEERVGPGDVLACGPDLVHSMVDAGADEKLATLHLYTGPIPYMVVYDVEGQRTLQVSGACGAWVPGPEHILREVPGIERRAAIA